MRIWTRKSALIQLRTSPGKSEAVVAGTKTTPSSSVVHAVEVADDVGRREDLELRRHVGVRPRESTDSRLVEARSRKGGWGIFVKFLSNFCQIFAKILPNFSKIFTNFCIQDSGVQYSILKHSSKSTRFYKIL